MTTDIDQKAREIAIDCEGDGERGAKLASRILAALQSARNDALEEAAQLLLREAQELRDGPGYYDEEIQDYERLTTAIRALKTTTG